MLRLLLAATLVWLSLRPRPWLRVGDMGVIMMIWIGGFRRFWTALGISTVALLSNNPDKADQLSRLGVTVTEQVPTRMHRSVANAAYLAAKARRNGAGQHAARGLSAIRLP